MISLPLIINPGRAKLLACGECTACCFKFSIDEINKPDDTRCIHQGKSNCTIHDDPNYPKQCGAFNCLWVQNLIAKGDINYRPDKCGVIFTTMIEPPFNGLIGVFNTQSLDSRMKRFLWEMEKKQLFFHESILRGPQELLDKWKEQWL